MSHVRRITEAGAAAPLRPPRAWLSTAAATLALWRFRRETRAHLRGLAADRLADLGLDAAAAWREAVKPFWRP